MKYIAISLMALMLTGCPFVKTEYEVRPVPVPVVIHSEVAPPEVDDMERLPIYDLTSESTDEEITVAIEQSIVILESYKKELQAAVRPFQEASEASRERSDRIAEQAVSRVQAAIDELLARQTSNEDNE